MFHGVILSGAKNPEYVCFVIAAITLWILRYSQNGKLFFTQKLKGKLD